MLLMYVILNTIRVCMYVCVCVCVCDVLHYVIEIDPLDVLSSSVCVVYTEVIQNVDGLLLLPIDR